MAVLRRSAENGCAEKICWDDLLRMAVLKRSAENGCAEKICWGMAALRRSAENGCAEKICWEWLWIKTSLKFLFFFRRVGLVDQDGKPPSRHFVLVGRPKLWWNANFEARGSNWGEMRILHVAVATLSSLRASRTSKPNRSGKTKSYKKDKRLSADY